jgi:hypothetical protein
MNPVMTSTEVGGAPVGVAHKNAPPGVANIMPSTDVKKADMVLSHVASDPIEARTDEPTSARGDPAGSGLESGPGPPDQGNDMPASSGEGRPEIPADDGDVARLADKSVAAPEAVQDGFGLATTVTEDAGAGAGGENVAARAVVASRAAPDGGGDADLADAADTGPDIGASKPAADGAERPGRDASADPCPAAGADDPSAITAAAHALDQMTFDGRGSGTPGGAANEAPVDKPTSPPDDPAGSRLGMGVGSPDEANDAPAGSGGGRPDTDAGNSNQEQRVSGDPPTVNGAGAADPAENPGVNDDAGRDGQHGDSEDAAAADPSAPATDAGAADPTENPDAADEAGRGEPPADGDGDVEQNRSPENLPRHAGKEPAKKPAKKAAKKFPAKKRPKATLENADFFKEGFDRCQKLAGRSALTGRARDVALYDSVESVVIYVHDARFTSQGFRMFCKQNNLACTKATEKNQIAAVIRVIEPGINKTTAGDRGIGARYALKQGCAPDGVAAFLAEIGLDTAVKKAREVRKAERLAESGSAQAPAPLSRLVISGVPDGLDGLVTFTVNIVANGQGRFISRAPVEMMADTPADSAAPPEGGDADEPSAGIASGALGEQNSPGTSAGAHDARQDGEDAAGDKNVAEGVGVAA